MAGLPLCTETRPFILEKLGLDNSQERYSPLVRKETRVIQKKTVSYV